MKAKKEASVAVIIGLILAALVTGGVLRARHALQSLKLPNKKTTDISQSPRPDAKSTDLFLELVTTDNMVTKEPKLTLSGKTLSGTYIAILCEKGDYLIVPSDVGSFSQEITLVKGVNVIKITVYQENGQKIEKSLTAVYTTAEI